MGSPTCTAGVSVAEQLRTAAFPAPQDFVFDPHGERLAVACGFDGHPALAAHLGDGADLVGGRLGRDVAGRLATSEWSGRYGAGWNAALRQRFEDFMRRCALPVRHRPWHAEQRADEVG